MSARLPEIPGYDVEAELGRGGMGVVYRARRRLNGHALALKLIGCGRGVSFAELARFRIEAEALACLDHPNIVKIRDVGVVGGHPFFAIDLAERGSLKEVAGRRRLPARWSAALVATLAGAMQHAHGRGMLHRDLKPANVLIAADGSPRITDFGLVKFAAPMAAVSEVYGTLSVALIDAELMRLARDSRAPCPCADGSSAEEAWFEGPWLEGPAGGGLLETQTAPASVRALVEQAGGRGLATLHLEGLTAWGDVMGSLGYMAPEQAAGDLGRIGPPTDVYALGGILYELLTGRPPVEPEAPSRVLTQILSEPPTPPRHADPTIAPELEAICLRCLEKEVRRRPPRAGTLADDLNEYLDRHPATGPEPSPWGPGPPGGAAAAVSPGIEPAGPGPSTAWPPTSQAS